MCPRFSARDMLFAARTKSLSGNCWNLGALAAKWERDPTGSRPPTALALVVSIAFAGLFLLSILRGVAAAAESYFGRVVQQRLDSRKV